MIKVDTIRGAIENTVSISLFNKGLAGRIFEDVKRYGAKVVMKNNSAECVLMSPEEYVRLMDEVNDARLLAEASARRQYTVGRILKGQAARCWIAYRLSAYS